VTPAAEVQDLTVSLGGRTVLEGVSAAIAPGTFVAVCGPNGAGKTTLLRALLGLVRPAAGSARLSGRDAATLRPHERAALAGYLPQERRLAWGVPALTVAALGAAERPPAEAEARAREALAAVGLAGLEERSVFEMSGGERARVLLARLLATRAPLLVLDEPIAGLDPAAQLQTLQILKAQASAGATVITTLHDLCLAGRFADRVLLLDEGRLVADDLPFLALAQEALARVFGLQAFWVETAFGRVLATGGLSEAGATLSGEGSAGVGVVTGGV
jgi:iron complex transport system ATP-binding protein